ncbi:MAG: metallophosphoesterase [Bacteroidota bacterium]
MSKEYVAILGDLHGHITLAYRLLKRYEVESGNTLAAIFQVGDFGAFPPPYKVDEATMRFWEKDPDELSFIDYYHGSKEADEILGVNSLPERQIKANLFFIKGNHEDFEFLNSLPQSDSAPASIDFYNKIFFLANGSINTFSIGNHKLHVASLGGVSYNNQHWETSKNKYYSHAEYRQLSQKGSNIDILLTHDVPFGSLYDDAGSRDILEFIEVKKPVLHFCGHYHEVGQQLSVTGKTQSYVLNEVNFKKPSKLNEGCIAIVEITDNKEFTVEILKQDWMKEFKRINYREL